MNVMIVNSNNSLLFILLLLFAFCQSCKEKPKAQLGEISKTGNNSSPKTDKVIQLTVYDSFNLYKNNLFPGMGESLLSLDTNFQNLKRKFGGSNNKAIKSQLTYLEINIFDNTNYRKFINEFDDCYKNEKYTKTLRKNCLYQLIADKVRHGDFKKTIELYNTYVKLYGIPIDFYSYIEYDIAKVRKYIIISDSLDLSVSAKDTMLFFKSQELEKVCATLWFEVDGICTDFSLAIKSYKNLISLYPQSRLADNAMNKIRILSFCGDGGFDDSLYREKIKWIQNILNKYPDTELKKDLELELFEAKVGSNDYGPREILEMGKRLLKGYPDCRCTEIKDKIKEITELLK
jgi:outer membrane protein assembly factor BamD (BamD/ComL family)